jgi:tRNA threonylcarbamoyladenosine biosynthesis protein TsaE
MVKMCCEIVLHSEKETKTFAKKLTMLLRVGDVVALDGDLGAGKTTLTQGIASALGIQQYVDSPTFTIIKEYTDGKIPLYHMDIYRLETTQGLGLEEYFYGDGICIVEWASKMKDELPENTIYLFLSVYEDGTRKVMVNPPPSRSEICRGATKV